MKQKQFISAMSGLSIEQLRKMVQSAKTLETFLPLSIKDDMHIKGLRVLLEQIINQRNAP